jgi:hypothetical protein
VMEAQITHEDDVAAESPISDGAANAAERAS